MNDKQQPSVIPSTQPPLAVVGISALFPKAASTEEFWSNIRRGVDASTEVPETHWNPADYFDSNQKSPDMTYARRGGFLSPLPFDPLEFGISPNNLEAIDTSQLLGLVGAKRALEHAGYGAGRTFDRSRVGCILGVTGTLEMVIPLGARLGHPRWRQALKDAGVADDVAEDVVNRISQSYVPWQENSFPGLLGNVVAGRIANRLDLHGTNCVVDAACASSLSAIHLAALELWTGRSDMVVTGGIDTFNDIFMFMCFSKTPALSPTGDAKPFSDEADGTILGEGVGMLVLKRQADAERDGDRIYAILKGIGTSSDGAGNAVYAPKAEGQIRCLQDAYRISGVSPDTVELVEAHGTGTKVGDATEVSGLMNVYQSTGRRGAWCAVGSIKSQIGHTKAAAGAAGVIKAILALQHRVLPPTIKVNRPPAAMLADDSPFYVNIEARPWVKPTGYPRRAAVSAFGFGGSNFHCVLEESPQKFGEPDWDGDVQVISLSGDDLNELAESVRSKVGTLSSSEWRNVRSFASASRNQFRVGQRHRILFVVERDKTDFAKLIASSLTMLERYPDKESWSTPEGAYYGRGEMKGKLGVLFPGQGSQYVGMLRELTCRFPVMNDVLSEANEVYADAVDVPASTPKRLSDIIFPPQKFEAAAKSEHEAALRATQVAQPAIGAISLAVLGVLDQFGVEPEAVAGHSYGELTALCASSRFAPRVLYRLSMLRGQLMAAAQDVEGGMLALGAPLTQIEAALKELSVDLVVANHNSPTQVVLSGRVPEIDRANALFSTQNIRGKKLAVAAAFHSPLVAPASRAFRPVLDDVEFSPSRMPVYANSTAEEYPSDPVAARDLLATQLARPVNFVSEIERMHSDGVRTFLEVGPGGVLTGLVNSILNGRDYRAIAVDSSSGKRSGMVDLGIALAQLSALGHAVRWDQWDPQQSKSQDPADSRRMRIPISGANYMKPRPPIPPRTVMKESMVDVKSKTTAGHESTPTAPVKTSTQPVAPQKFVVPPAAVPSTATPIAKLEKRTLAVPAISKVIPPMTDASTSNDDTRETIRQTLAALQRMQHETTRLHQQFLDGQEAAFKTFERLAEQQLAGTSRTQEGVRESDDRFRPVREVARPGAPASIEVPAVSTKTSPRSEKAVLPAPAAIVSLLTTAAVAAPSVDARPLNVVPVLPVTPGNMPDAVIRSTANPIPKPNPIAVPATRPSAGSTSMSSLGSTVLAVVSEKTGYPTEMLNLEMSLDHDLGIDSIKRVEILSALQERVPNLPAFQPDELGSLHTLHDVVTLADARASKSSTTTGQVPASPVDQQATVPALKAPVVATPVSVTPVKTQTASLGPTVLAVVAEKTGYPTEMLNLEMSLDHDLGIDSIKRVEILSALQERVPNLPAFQPDELGSLHTLQDVVTLADARTANASIVPAQAKSPATVVTSTNDPAKVQAVPATNREASSLASVVLAVVSEKTGYPTEMLNLEMSLDHDLGIDSIKRVEILSALQERVPNLPAFQPDELGSLHTLRDVVRLADNRCAQSADATTQITVGAGRSRKRGETTVASTDVAASEPTSLLGPTILEVVSEKTGYPTEMLNLEMSLDHDLGIDSIKRVEILSALQERVPNLPAFQPEELGSLHTLRDVVTLADARSAGMRPSKQGPTLESAVTVRPSPKGTFVPAASLESATNDLGPIVLQVVSEKTGYPTEMLNLDMSLDHDLGIDSIKRVEILSALQERVPNLPAFQPEELGSLHTLRDVVVLANARTTESTVTPPQTPMVSRPTARISRADARVKRSIVRLAPLPLVSGRTLIGLIPGSEIWITDDGSDLSQRIASELTDRGFRAQIVELGMPGSVPVSDGLAGLIVVAPETGMTDTQLWNAIEWLQSVGAVLRRNSQVQSTLFATVSRLDGQFGFESTRLLQDPVSGGLAGLAKCAAREWPEIVSRAFDLSPNWSANHVPATMFVSELLHQGPVEVGISPKGCCALETVETSLTGQPQSRPIASGELVVISGGARGVTAEAAVAIANAWHPRMAILGRSPEPVPEPEWLAKLTTEAEIKKELIARATAGATPKVIAAQCQQVVTGREIARQLHRIRSLGISVDYYSVDVRDLDSVRSLIKRIELKCGPVRGLIHGAGVLADQKIEDKTQEQFDRVYQTKIGGLNSLLRSVDPTELRVLGLFSSYTARFGRIGQTDYAIANEVLNKMARQFSLQHPQCRVASFNWGPWDGGMVQGGLKQLFASEGVGLIPLEAGSELLVREFENGTERPVEILVLASDEPRKPMALNPGTLNAGTSIPVSNIPNGIKIRKDLNSAERGEQGSSADLEKASDLKVVLEMELDISRYPFLESHVLGGKAALPVAMMLEWLAHAAIHRNPGLELRGFEDFRVFQGIRLGAHDRVQLKILAGKSIRVEDRFTSRVQITTESAGRTVLHAGGNVVLSPTYAAVPPAALRLPAQRYAMDLSTAYDERLFHGTMFRGILSIDGCSENGIGVTTRVAPTPWAWMSDPVRGSWLADPLAIDAALQAVILWSQEMRGKPCLPCAIMNYRQFRRTFPKAGVQIVINLREAPEQLIRCDVEFVDHQGILVARMEGCESIADGSLVSAFQRNQIEASV